MADQGVDMQSPDNRRWFHYPLVWMLIALPLSAVIGSMITIYFAVSTDDGLVADDYYEKGKQINLDLARDRAASSYRLQAVIQLNYQENSIRVRLDPGMLATRPASLQLAFHHATIKAHDFVIQLQTSAQGDYYALLPRLARGKWYVQLSDADWRMQNSLTVPDATQLTLTPHL